jgi:hypothetical protein
LAEERWRREHLPFRAMIDEHDKSSGRANALGSFDARWKSRQRPVDICQPEQDRRQLLLPAIIEHCADIGDRPLPRPRSPAY